MKNLIVRMAPGLTTAIWAAALTAAAEKPEWEDLEVNSVNRLPARTYTVPLAAEADALTDALEPETPYRLSLNGNWKISWAGRPQDRVKDFWKVDFDDSKWLTIDVPSCVEMRGFGAPGYTNVRYPHKMEWPKILDRDTGKPDYNPVSSYRTTFTVPADWAGRRVILRFDGVYSAYYVWVNGKKVGYAEDSKLPSEFDITPYLVPNDAPGTKHQAPGTRHQAPGTNLLAVEVYRWCDGSYLEDQDMFRYSGIYRDVTLWAMPRDGIWDFAVKTTPVDGYEKWKLEVEGEWEKVKVEGQGQRRMSVSLYGPDKKKIGDLVPTPTPTPTPTPNTCTYSTTLAARAWSAEDPCLYTLVVRSSPESNNQTIKQSNNSQTDIRMRRIGFKEQKIVGHTFLVNGQKVKFKGVNRHETNPDNGRQVTLDDMLADIRLMKRYNINTVRTSHYPDHRLWYELCDRYGIYLCAEANVEGHEPQYGEKGLGRFKEWNHSIVERNARHATFYRNHPSVTLWSMGNETGHGDCFRNAMTAVRKIDPTRPIHWERGNADADVDSRMYPTAEWLEKRGQLGDGQLDAEADKWAKQDQQHRGKAFFMCEYAHAMGNAMGNFQEYWDAFYNHDSLAGGCIWDWVDQAVWKYTDRVDPKTGKRDRYLAYGGDFDEDPNDGPFCCNGVVDPFRNVSAKLVEVGHVHRNLVVTRKPDGTLELWNRFAFTWADAYDGRWELLEEGRVVASGAFAVPHLAPLSRGPLALELPSVAKDGKERFLNVNFVLKADTLWAEKGWPVARNQVAYGEAAAFALKTSPAAKPAVAEDEKTVTVTAGGTKAVFCRRSGTLAELTLNGKTILKDPAPGVVTGPQLTCERAFTDNDIWLRQGQSWSVDRAKSFYGSGLTQLRYHARPIEVKDGAVRIVTEVTGLKSAGFTHEATWTFGADGAVSVRNVVTPRGVMPPALPRLGLSLKLDKSLEAMRYYGRGPRENYIDRKTGSFFGVWDSTVTEQYEPYVRPQDNGSKCDVRWVEFRDADGRGVRFSASAPLYLQALHYGMEDLEFARHRNGQQRFRTPLVPRGEVCLNLDIRQLGLGGASCGPGPIWSKYVFPVQREEWTLRLEGISL